MGWQLPRWNLRTLRQCEPDPFDFVNALLTDFLKVGFGKDGHPTGPGHELPLVLTTKPSLERPLFFETSRRANSHKSALCGAPHKADYVDHVIMLSYRTIPFRRHVCVESAGN